MTDLTIDLYNKVVNSFGKINRFDNYSVFSDFFEIASLEISRAFFKDDANELLKQFYGKYTKKEMAVLGEIYNYIIDLMQCYQTNGVYYDVAGRIFHILNMQSKDKGQFFTPQHLADLCSRLVITKDIDNEIATKGYITVSEPACGGGAQVLAMATALTKAGYNPQKVMFTTATDVDKRCAYMCFFQLSYYGLPAIVVHGNTLTLDEWDTFKTPAYYLDFWDMRESHEH